MTEWAIISVSLAVVAYFGYHAICKLISHSDAKARYAEIERTRKDLDDAIESGYCGRAAYLHRRLQELLGR